MKLVNFSGKMQVPVKMWLPDGYPIEASAEAQLRSLAELPFLYKHVAVMPDAHAGIGSTVGSVIATKGAVIPAAVGVDIGCGMQALKTALRASDLPDDLSLVRSEIERVVPHGRTANGGPGDRGAWSDPPEKVQYIWKNYEGRMHQLYRLYPKLEQNNGGVQLGTLGTGNHFIEICLDTERNVWIMLHSGSRGFGNRIGSFFGDLAAKDCEQWFVNLPHKHLAYFPKDTDHFIQYMTAVNIAQDYAASNRDLMMGAVSDVLYRLVKPFTVLTNVDCHHNYIALEHHYGENVYVTRKGAVRARTNDYGIIPGSMGAKSFIVRGRSFPESFCSCSHGAGRVMSRTEAKKTFTLEDHAQATLGVECRKDAEVIDETPGAYKPIDLVMAAQADMVEIIAELKQVLCVKG